MKAKLKAGEVRDINDLITLNLDTWQFARDVIASCEGPDLLRAFWRAIEKISILDPTCGSGAFLFAALKILEPLYDACLDRMEAFVAELDSSSEKHRPEKFSDFRKVLNNVAAHPNRRYFILKSIILNNLYGVDIMEEAVEICKLRLFLKLAAQVDPETAQDNLGIEPLPDIDFNIRAGNTLVGFTSITQVRDAAENEQGESGQRRMIYEKEDEVADIEKQAADLQQDFDAFRARQIEGDGSVPTEHKQELRRRLKALDDDLDRYLAGEDGLDSAKQKEYAKWLKSHQPFHWFVEFYGIIRSGGFDVIFGNPPYVEYRHVRHAYSLQSAQYSSERVGNLYAFCMERSFVLLRHAGWFGMIVPSALLGLDEAASLRSVLAARFTSGWLSTYAIRPSKLFDGVDQRLCICLATSKGPRSLSVWTTCYQHWYSEERAALFSKSQYALSSVHDRLDRIPQIGRDQASGALKKLESKSNRTIAYFYSHNKRGFLMHYHRSPRYWIRAMDFEQYFKSATRTRSVHHFRDIHFADKYDGKFIGAVLNSAVFFFWFVSIGNGRNITATDVEQFPVGPVDEGILAVMQKDFDKLMRDYDKNSFIRERQDCEFQEFRPSKSKAIIDEIDAILARHYGFTEEELDFIINYDIKYRMGLKALSEAE